MFVRLKELRKENRLRQWQVSEKLNLKQQTYSRYELGKIEPSIEVLAKLSELYDVSVDYILGLTDVRERYKISEFAEKNT